MSTKNKQKLNIAKTILIGSMFVAALTSSAFAVEKQTSKNHSAVLSGTEAKAEANKPVINKEDRASFIRFLKCIEQAYGVNNSYSFEEYPIFIKALEEMQYLQRRGFKIADLINDIGADKDHAEWFKRIVVTGTPQYARFVSLYDYGIMPAKEIMEDYENELVTKQSELMAAKAKSASESYNSLEVSY